MTLLRTIAPTTLLLLAAMSLQTLAQDTEYPSSMVQFLKSGMKIGISKLEDHHGLNITVFSDDEFQIALDARSLKTDELAKKYPSVAEKKQNSIAIAKRGRKLEERHLSANVKVVFDAKMVLCTVEHVTDDYVLVRNVHNNNARMAFASHSIEKISWGESGFDLYVHVFEK